MALNCLMLMLLLLLLAEVAELAELAVWYGIASNGLPERRIKVRSVECVVSRAVGSRLAGWLFIFNSFLYFLLLRGRHCSLFATCRHSRGG